MDGGSFLARHGEEVFNTFLLAFPDGNVVRHNMDDPTNWETCYFRGGTDDGILPTPIAPVGPALCWEFIRSRTAKRLRKKVKMVSGGSCWWTLPDDADPASPRWAVNPKMLQDAPVRMARMPGVPVIHASHSGRFAGIFGPELSNVAYNPMFPGEAMIVDANGRVPARRTKEEGEGVVMAEVRISRKNLPPAKPFRNDSGFPGNCRKTGRSPGHAGSNAARITRSG